MISVISKETDTRGLLEFKGSLEYAMSNSLTRAIQQVSVSQTKIKTHTF